MKHILVELAKINKFELDHQRLCIDVDTCQGKILHKKALIKFKLILIQRQ